MNRSGRGERDDDPSSRGSERDFPGQTDRGAHHWSSATEGPRPPSLERDARRGHTYSDPDRSMSREYGTTPAQQGAPSFRGRGPKGYKRSDERIKEEVCEALTDDHEVDASEIDVSVKNGEVTLAGWVGERRIKYLAEQIVDHVGGVVEIHNQLRVRRDDRREGSSAQTVGTAGGGNGNGVRDEQ